MNSQHCYLVGDRTRGTIKQKAMFAGQAFAHEMGPAEHIVLSDLEQAAVIVAATATTPKNAKNFCRIIPVTLLCDPLLTPVRVHRSYQAKIKYGWALQRDSRNGPANAGHYE